MLTLRRGRRGRRWSPSIIQRVYTDQLVSALQAACSKSSLKFSNSHQRASGRTRPRPGAASEQRRPASSCPPGGTRQRIQKVCFQTDQTLTSVHTDLRVSEHRPLSSGWGRGTQPQGRWWSHQMHPRTLIQVQKHSSHYYTLCGKGRDLYSVQTWSLPAAAALDAAPPWPPMASRRPTATSNRCTRLANSAIPAGEERRNVSEEKNQVSSHSSAQTRSVLAQVCRLLQSQHIQGFTAQLKPIRNQLMMTWTRLLTNKIYLGFYSSKYSVFGLNTDRLGPDYNVIINNKSNWPIKLLLRHIFTSWSCRKHLPKPSGSSPAQQWQAGQDLQREKVSQSLLPALWGVETCPVIPTMSVVHAKQQVSLCRSKHFLPLTNLGKKDQLLSTPTVVKLTLS